MRRSARRGLPAPWRMACARRHPKQSGRLRRGRSGDRFAYPILPRIERMFEACGELLPSKWRLRRAMHRADAAAGADASAPGHIRVLMCLPGSPGLLSPEPPNRSVEPEAQLAQQPREPLLLCRLQAAEEFRLGVDEPRDRGIHSNEAGRTHLDEDSAAVVRVGLPGHEPALDQPVDAIRHGAARDEGLLQQLLGGEAVRGAGAPERREHVELGCLELRARERLAPGAIEVLREPCDAGEHLQRREVEVGALALPVVDDPVDLVSIRHAAIIPRSIATLRRAGRTFVEWAARRRDAGATKICRAPAGRLLRRAGGPVERCRVPRAAPSGMADLLSRTASGPRGPPWCNGSTTAFGAVRSRFESWRRSMDTNLAIIVLAAEQGTRMKSVVPKLLHPLAGAPIVAHVLATARALDAAHVITVVRHERDLVAAAVAAELPDAVIVDQDEIPGTGRAVEQALAALPDDFEGEVLVLNGDVPLLNAGTLTA